MEVHLKPEQEAFIQHRVRAGVNATLDEAVQEAIALLEARDHSVVTPTGRKSLAQLFAESPFKGMDLEFPRDPSPMRDVEL